MFLSEMKFQQMSGVLESTYRAASRDASGFSDNQPSLLQKIARSDKPALFPVWQRFPSFAAAATLPRQQTGVIAAVGTAFYSVLCT